MKSIITLVLSFLLILPAVAQPEGKQGPPVTRQEEPPDLSPRIMFNGKDLTGWHVDVPVLDVNPDTTNPFIVRNGMLVTLGNPRGHLTTDASYANYRLEVEYRFQGKPGNCGVLIHTTIPRAMGIYPRSVEVQMQSGNAGDFYAILEDLVVPDMEARRGPKEKWGSSSGTQRRIPNLTDDSENPPGEWNTMIIECLDDQVKVWVNGDLVNYGFNCTANKGQITLQAEGSEVEFRKVVLTPIRELTQ